MCYLPAVMHYAIVGYGVQFSVESTSGSLESGVQALLLSLSDVCLWCAGVVAKARLILQGFRAPDIQVGGNWECRQPTGGKRESGVQALPLSFSNMRLWCTGAVAKARLILQGFRPLGIQAGGN